MNQVFELKRGDRKRALKYRVSDYSSAGRFAGTNVAFRMMNAAGDVVIDGVAGILDDNGIFGYAWKVNETDTPGEYRAEFVITHSDGLEETYPSSGYINVRIAEDVS